MEYQRGTLQRFDFPDGESLNVGTLKLMAAMVRQQSEHPRIRARVRQVLADAGVGSMDYDGMIAAVWSFILANVRYVRDPLGAEHLSDPVELDYQIDDGNAAEDCESLALYAATLFASIGITTEFEAQGKDKKYPGDLTHCSLVVIQPRSGARVSFDLVGAQAMPGKFGLGDTLAEPGERIEHWTLNGEKKEETSMRGMGGAVMQSGFGGAVMQSGFGDAQPADSGGVGWGTVVGGVLSLAGSIVSAATGKPIGTALPGGPVPLASVGVVHSVDVPTMSASTKKTLYTIAGVAAAVFIGSKIIRGRRRAA